MPPKLPDHTAWDQPTNPHTTRNIRELRTEIGELQDSLQRVGRDFDLNDPQREAVGEAWRLLGQARNVLAPAGVDR